MNKQYEGNPGNSYQRNGCGSGQKAIGPVLGVEQHFRPIDHCYLHDNVVHFCKRRREYMSRH